MDGILRGGSVVSASDLGHDHEGREFEPWSVHPRYHSAFLHPVV